MKKLVLSVAVLLLAFAGFFIIKQDARADSYGQVTIIVLDEYETEVINDKLDFDEGESLFELLDEHYSIGCADNSYHLSDVCEKTSFGGHVILGIDDVLTDWYSSYLAIYINDTYSNKGIDLIELTDGDTYLFQYTSLGGASNVDE